MEDLTPAEIIRETGFPFRKKEIIVPDFGSQDMMGRHKVFALIGEGAHGITVAMLHEDIQEQLLVGKIIQPNPSPRASIVVEYEPDLKKAARLDLGRGFKLNRYRGEGIIAALVPLEQFTDANNHTWYGYAMPCAGIDSIAQIKNITGSLKERSEKLRKILPMQLEDHIRSRSRLPSTDDVLQFERGIMHKLLLAHSINELHCDPNLGNVLVAKNYPIDAREWIIDWSTSHTAPSPVSRPPQLFSKQNLSSDPTKFWDGPKYDIIAEVYAFGGGLGYTYATGIPPCFDIIFKSRDSKEVFRHYRSEMLKPKRRLEIMVQIGQLRENNQITPAHELNPELDKELSVFLATCLEADISKRFSSAQQVFDEANYFWSKSRRAIVVHFARGESTLAQTGSRIFSTFPKKDIFEPGAVKKNKSLYAVQKDADESVAGVMSDYVASLTTKICGLKHIFDSKQTSLELALSKHEEIIAAWPDLLRKQIPLSIAIGQSASILYHLTCEEKYKKQVLKAATDILETYAEPIDAQRLFVRYAYSKSAPTLNYTATLYKVGLILWKAAEFEPNFVSELERFTRFICERAIHENEISNTFRATKRLQELDDELLAEEKSFLGNKAQNAYAHLPQFQMRDLAKLAYAAGNIRRHTVAPDILQKLDIIEQKFLKTLERFNYVLPFDLGNERLEFSLVYPHIKPDMYGMAYSALALGRLCENGTVPISVVERLHKEILRPEQISTKLGFLLGSVRYDQEVRSNYTGDYDADTTYIQSLCALTLKEEKRWEQHNWLLTI